MDSDDPSIIVGNFCSTIEQTIGYLDAQWYNITAITALVYGIPSLLLNIRIYTLLFMYRKQKEFNSPFYVVFVIASVVDSFYWISNQLKDHVGVAPALHFMLLWIPRTGFVVSWWYFLTFYLMFADMLITVLVSFNRFLTIVFYHGDIIWKKAFPIGLAIVFTVPIAFSWQLLFNTIAKCDILNFGQRYYIILQAEEYKYGLQLNLGEFIVSLCSAFINAILNISTVISVVKQRKNISKNVGPKRSTVHIKGPEMKLLILSFIMFINQCSYGGIQLGFFISKFFPNSITNVRLFEASRFIIDYMCLSPAWILVIMNKHLRKRILPGIVPTMGGSIKNITTANAVQTF